MAKRVTRRIRRFRRHIRRPRKMTAIRLTKFAIALTPVGLNTYEQWKASGPVGAAEHLVGAYTGWSLTAKNFDATRLAEGYVPLFGAWLFGKFASRVLR